MHLPLLQTHVFAVAVATIVSSRQELTQQHKIAQRLLMPLRKSKRSCCVLHTWLLAKPRFVWWQVPVVCISAENANLLSFAAGPARGVFVDGKFAGD